MLKTLALSFIVLCSCTDKPGKKPTKPVEQLKPAVAGDEALIAKYFRIKTKGKIFNLKHGLMINRSKGNLDYQIKFNCSEDYFQRTFLKSELLDNHKTNVLNPNPTNLNKWWKPDLLKEVKYFSQKTKTGDSTAEIQIFSGIENERFTVYARFIETGTINEKRNHRGRRR